MSLNVTNCHQLKCDTKSALGKVYFIHRISLPRFNSPQHVSHCLGHLLPILPVFKRKYACYVQTDVLKSDWNLLFRFGPGPLEALTTVSRRIWTYLQVIRHNLCNRKFHIYLQWHRQFRASLQVAQALCLPDASPISKSKYFNHFRLQCGHDIIFCDVFSSLLIKNILVWLISNHITTKSAASKPELLGCDIWCQWFPGTEPGCCPAPQTRLAPLAPGGSKVFEMEAKYN